MGGPWKPPHKGFMKTSKAHLSSRPGPFGLDWPKDWRGGEIKEQVLGATTRYKAVAQCVQECAKLLALCGGFSTYPGLDHIFHECTDNNLIRSQNKLSWHFTSEFTTKFPKSFNTETAYTVFIITLVVVVWKGSFRAYSLLHRKHINGTFYWNQ